MKADTDSVVEVQVKVPVCLTLRLKRDDAESMLKEELCRVVDDVLEDASRKLGRITSKDRAIDCGYDIGPHWDAMPDDECDLVYTEDGLFPDESDDE